MGRHQFPLVLNPAVEQFLTAVAEETGYDFDVNSPDLRRHHRQARRRRPRSSGATLRDTANPTMLKAGYKANVIPASAEAVIDCRVLPGRKEAFEREVDELIGPDVTREWITDLPSYETTFDGDLVDAMNAAILAAGSRGPHRALHDVRRNRRESRSSGWGFGASGFAPLRLPPELDFAALFHGVDERVPVDALQFGAGVLEHFLRNC